MSLGLNQGIAFYNHGSATEPVVLYDPGSVKVTEESSSLLKMTNIASPLDAPTTWKVSNTRIANVYQTLAKGAIAPGLQTANVSGQSIFVESNVIASIFDSGGIRTGLTPIQIRVELRLPNCSDLEDAAIKTAVKQTLALLQHPTTGAFRVTQMMRGVLSLES